ncbi:MAG: DUF4405 domain-containing protein [Desulfobacterales bacterium]|nr:DUF4405 domain-containing protein [Desulfobacterales bacterium]
MKKNVLKYFINCLLFVHMCSIAALGLLLGFVIPKGGARGAQNLFLGLHRHEWGDIHLSLSLFFLVLLVVHILLGWKWVIQSTKNTSECIGKIGFGLSLLHG